MPGARDPVVLEPPLPLGWGYLHLRTARNHHPTPNFENGQNLIGVDLKDAGSNSQSHDELKFEIADAIYIYIHTYIMAKAPLPPAPGNHLRT